MNFLIKEPEMPSEDRLAEAARKWWDMLEPHCFHKWNDALMAVTYPVIMVTVSPRMVMDLLKSAEKSDPASLKIQSDMAAMIDAALDGTGLENRFFAKLCSRSPKDYLSDGGKPRPLVDGADCVDALLSSMRCFEDMFDLRHIDGAYIVLRPYVDFEPWQEWRVFVKDGQIAGISQYYYLENFPELQGDFSPIGRDITSFMEGTVITNFPLKDFVADVIMEEKPVLLEINPFGLSDPCLFRDYSALDGSMRVFSGQTREMNKA